MDVQAGLRSQEVEQKRTQEWYLMLSSILSSYQCHSGTSNLEDLGYQVPCFRQNRHWGGFLSSRSRATCNGCETQEADAPCPHHPHIHVFIVHSAKPLLSIYCILATHYFSWKFGSNKVRQHLHSFDACFLGEGH